MSIIAYEQMAKGVSDITGFIIHQTHYEISDWSTAFNQFTIACELDMINACNICCRYIG